MKRYLCAIALSWTLLGAGCAAAAHPTAEQPTPLPTEGELKEFTLERRLTRSPSDGTVVVPTIPPTPTLTPVPGQTVAPAGPVLRAQWPRPSTGATSPAWLLYNLTQYSGGPSSRPFSTFWRIDPPNPTQPQKVLDVPTDNRYGVVGELSPDGQWIAYLGGSDVPHTLQLIRSDGSDSRVVTNRIGTTDLRCIRTFAWSPDGTHLTFRQEWSDGTHFGQAFFVYAPQTDTVPRQVVQVGDARLVGWYDQNRVLALMSIDYRQPLQLEAIAVDTGTREVLATLPNADRLFCASLSPDRQQLLLDMNTTTYLYTFAHRQFTLLDVVAGRTLWGADSTTLLEFSGDYDRAVRLVKLPPPGVVTHIALAPQEDPGQFFGLLSASPDGKYLAGCDINEPSLKRSILYDIDQQRWHLLAKEQFCLDILGWLPVR